MLRFWNLSIRSSRSQLSTLKLWDFSIPWQLALWRGKQMPTGDDILFNLDRTTIIVMWLDILLPDRM